MRGGLRPPESAHFRNVVGRYPTGVAIVTAATSEGPAGMAVNSFTSASLDPPLIIFCPAHSSTTWPVMQSSGIVAVNILAVEQEALGRQFAATGGDRFDGVRWSPGVNGAPLLAGASAWIEAHVVAEHPAGDHTVVIAMVDHLGADEGRDEPLIFHRGAFTGRRSATRNTIDGRAK
ncbi:flavin reductase family protein [Rhodococcus ruber]|uniref:Flavin reductase family protein n=1 Tax=Rhodococcus ruber TaxID=1830 RepID=A0ABT4MER2_9NOCA|nr:flavin reductase family protein [Rhodococcus ruber]MCZ4519476.1 flavin reductase family protein [Rhodococcus ruber]